MFRLLLDKHVIFIQTLALYILLWGIDLKYEWHAAIYAFTFLNIMWLLRVMDQRLAIPEFLSLSMVLSYCTVPALMFDLDLQKDFHPATFGWDIIAIQPNSYYTYALSASVLLFLIVITFFKKFREREKVLKILTGISSRYNITNVFILFGFVGFISSLLLGRIAMLDYLFYLGSQLTALLLFLSLVAKTKQAEIYYILIAVGLMLINTVNTGMFGNLFYSLIFYFFFRVLLKGMPASIKLMLPIVGLFFILFLQVFKVYYRLETWDKKNASSFSVFFDVLENTAKKDKDDLLRQGSVLLALRMNQAYLSSRTLKYVPEYEPYANGETIYGAVASFIPRVLWPNKPILSGIVLMRKYGKYDPGGSVSMSIGQLGEAYANFGRFGGIMFMGFYSILILGVLRLVFYLSRFGKPFIIFLPLIFFHMIKVEVIFSKSFNTAFKSFIFAFVIIFLMEFLCKKKPHYRTKFLSPASI